MAEAETREAATASSAWFRLLTARPAVEPLIFVALALVYIWLIQPTRNDWLRVPFLIVTVLIPIASPILHRDSLRDLGLRLDNLWRSAREVALMTLVGAALVTGVGVLANAGPSFQPAMLMSLLFYPGWGLAQQYAMQSFAYRRFREAIGRPVPAAALTAFLFASLHLPNLALCIATLVGGYVWIRLFERNPNILTLAIAHGWLAVLLKASWPGLLIHGLRIGPTYWSWTP